jgi:O-antigen ligase
LPVVFFLIRGFGVRAGPALLIAASMALIPLSVLRPELGLYALVLTFVNEFDSYYELQQYVPLSLPFLFDIAISLGILMQLVMPGRMPRLDSAQNVLLLFYVVLVVLSVLLSNIPMPPGYWATFRTGFLIRPIFYLFLILLIASPERLHRLLFALLVAHTLLMVSSMSDYLQRGGGLYRVGGTVSAVNYLSYLCIATLPLLVSLFVYVRERWSRNFLLVLSLTTLFVSLQTLSRSGYYALLATFAFFTYRFTRRPRTLLIAAALGAAFYYLVPTELTERLDQIESLTTTGRYYLSRVGLRMALDNPLLGVGLHGYLTEFLKYDYEGLFDRPRAPHSLYFAIAASSGFLALAIYLSMYAITLFQIGRVRRRYERARDFVSLGYWLAVGIEGGLIGHFVFGLAGNYADSYYAYLLLGLAVISIRYHHETPGPAALP